MKYLRIDNQVSGHLSFFYFPVFTKIEGGIWQEKWYL